MTEKTILQQALQWMPEMVKHRRWIHAHAEVGFELQQTQAYVQNVLTAMGYAPKSCGKGGILADIGGKRPGKTFLLRADMDALPVPEATGLPFACHSGYMHACGHDLHTAMLLGAAAILKEWEPELCGTVRLLFQPAEEIFEGAKEIIACGGLKNPRVDAAMMLHVAVGIPVSVGTVLLSPPGICTPSADNFTVQVFGTGCHGAAPQDGVDALSIAARILLAFQQINARELGLYDETVLTIGTFRAGSTANAIAGTAIFEGTLRTMEESTRCRVKKRMEEITAGIADAFRASATLTFNNSCPSLQNDPELCQQAEHWLSALLGKRAVSVEKLGTNYRPSAGGSEDFAYISRQVPSIMAALAAGTPEKGYRYPLHHPKVLFDEESLPYGAAALTGVALYYLGAL